MAMPLTRFSTDDGVLTVSWTFSVPPQAVWDAFGQPRLLSQWLGTALECDLAAGGMLRIDHGEDTVSRSRVKTAREPERLAMSWEFPDEPESDLDIAFAAAETGSTLELRHRGLGALAGSYLPGWLTHLAFLEAAVSGSPLPWGQFWSFYATLDALCYASPASIPVTGVPARS